MNKLANIYLIGPMGAGKTTVGKELAKILRLPFYDSDKVIEEQTGVDISTIFEYEGEQGFRLRELNILQELTQIEGCVLATGGGSILNAENRQILKANGFVVYLQCSIDKLLQRTKKDTQRPLLYTNNTREQIKTLLTEREDFYSSCADFKIETSGVRSQAVIQTILNNYSFG